MRAEVPKVLIWVKFKVTTSKLGDTMHQVKLSDEKNQSKSGLGQTHVKKSDKKISDQSRASILT